MRCNLHKCNATNLPFAYTKGKLVALYDINWSNCGAYRRDLGLADGNDDGRAISNQTSNRRFGAGNLAGCHGVTECAKIVAPLIDDIGRRDAGRLEQLEGIYFGNVDDIWHAAIGSQARIDPHGIACL